MASSYEGFAHLYDKLQSDVPYDDYVDYYLKALEKFGGEKGLCLDLGCGTGNITLRLSQKGFDMIGVDSSLDMLDVAREKAERSGANILFLNQDMRSFELYGTVGAVFSSLDCMNYVTDSDDLKKVFELVNNYLDPGGIFVFDMNSEYKLAHILGDNTYVSSDEDIFYSWEISFDEESRICTFYLTFFEKYEDLCETYDEERRENVYYTKVLYERFDEVHEERAYSVDEIKKLLEDAGLEFLGAYDDLSFEPWKDDSERIFFIARNVDK